MVSQEPGTSIRQVNGAKVAVPVTLQRGIRVEERPPYVLVSTPFGLLAQFDGDQELFVQLDERYQGQLCGLCGTYSGSQLDDFQRPDGILEHDPDAFGSSWRVTDDLWGCDPSTPVPPHCSPAQEVVSEDLCRVILATQGPFAACHESLPPQLYFESCVYDQCATGGAVGQFCKSLEAYAAACQLAGVDLGDWKKETVCAPPSTIPTETTTPTPQTGPGTPTPPAITLPSSESCLVSGDPHYYTFDKQTHHFMGNCTYTLSQRCPHNSSLPHFNVEATNEHRWGNTQVSYVQSVDVDVSGIRISLGKGGAVKVDGKEVVVPTSPTAGVEVKSSGFYRVVSMDFGLRVKFDGDHQVEVTLPSAYKGQVCGMCGNYNGNPADDFENPRGEVEPDSTSLGNSWLVSNHSSCSSGHGPECSEAEKEVAQSSRFCGLILDVTGPFRHCHGALDPTGHFTGCLYDQCALHLDPGSLCRSLQSYADACQSLGVPIETWRNATFCPVSCPPNSHYESCGTACPGTCVDPSAPSTCGLPCTEACICDSGFLLYDGSCVSSRQCGCWHEGKHYPVGSEFWTDDTCSSKCTCPSRGGQLNCHSASCPKGSYCGVQNAVPGCYPYTYGVCQAYGDPHYNTFDKETHHFMGNCTYTLAKVCGSIPELPFFNVEAKNEHRGNPSVSYVQRVLVEVYGQQIEILKNHPNQVLVNKVLTTLPVIGFKDSVTVSRSGRYVTLETDFGLTVSYDTDHSVEIRVPTTYFNRTCGMCGNFNNRRQDDSLMPNGSPAQSSIELGNSWKVPGAEHDEPSCGVEGPKPPCPPEQEELYKTDAFCGLLSSSQGPFAACQSVLNPQGFFDSCAFDLCAYHGDRQLLCSALETYAVACQRAGVVLPGWRNATFCPPACPPNTHYEPCWTACPATCLQQEAPGNCSQPCAEGCACDAGLVLSGGDCVPVARCGCVHAGQYYSEGESFVTEGCTKHCVCQGNSKMECTPLSCSPDEVCKVQHGLRGCYPASTATCHVYGDPHYSTFDGRLHHFQGACNYSLVQACDNTTAPFSITARNEHRGSPRWTALNSVAVTLKGLHIALRKGRAVYINGILASPSLVSLPDATIQQIGSYVQVTTNLGVRVQFDGNQDLLITLTEKYRGRVCGLCGTYTGNPGDDFSTPAGETVEDVNTFGDSWRIPDDKWPCNSTAVLPETCPPSNQEAAEKQCHPLLAGDGPFSLCHSTVPPRPYFESCTQDLCATGGSSAQLCSVLRSYAAACRAAGVVLGDWESKTICESCFFNCSFDGDFCEWQQSVVDDFDWSRTKHCALLASAGNTSACSSSGGYYIYADSHFAHVGEKGQLMSPECTAREPSCFRFWYRMAGASEEDALKVYLVQEGAADPLLVWLASGSKGDRWLPAEVDLHISGWFQILLEGVTGSDNQTRLAVDEVSLDPGCCLGVEDPTPPEPSPTGETTKGGTTVGTIPMPVPETSTPPTTTAIRTCHFNCSFDESFCEWTQSMLDDFDWSRAKHFSLGSPPAVSSGSYYIYADSHFAHVGEKGQLMSPECTAREPSCFRFWYRMAGASEEDALKVYLVQEGAADPLLVWLASGSKGDRWLPAEVDLHISGRFQVLLEGVTGPENRTRLSVDEVSLEPGCCLGEAPTPEEATPSGQPTSQVTSPQPETPVPAETPVPTEASTTGQPTSQVTSPQPETPAPVETPVPTEASTTGQPTSQVTSPQPETPVPAETPVPTEASTTGQPTSQVTSPQPETPAPAETPVPTEASTTGQPTSQVTSPQPETPAPAETPVPTEASTTGQPTSQVTSPQPETPAPAETPVPTEASTTGQPTSQVTSPQPETPVPAKTPVPTEASTTGQPTSQVTSPQPETPAPAETPVPTEASTTGQPTSQVTSPQPETPVPAETPVPTEASTTGQPTSQVTSPQPETPAPAETPVPTEASTTGQPTSQVTSPQPETPVPAKTPVPTEASTTGQPTSQVTSPQPETPVPAETPVPTEASTTGEPTSQVTSPQPETPVPAETPVPTEASTTRQPTSQVTSPQPETPAPAETPVPTEASTTGQPTSQVTSPQPETPAPAETPVPTEASTTGQPTSQVTSPQPETPAPAETPVPTEASTTGQPTSQVTSPQPKTPAPAETPVPTEASTTGPGETTSQPLPPSPEAPASSTPSGSSPSTSQATARPATTAGNHPPPAGRATCSASGDPHYTTFDGRVHHFMGVCTYTLSRVCGNSSGLPGAFDISTTNEHRGSNTAVSYVSSVHVEVYGSQVSLLKNRKVNINGSRRELPVIIGNNQITVQISGSYILLETDFGLGVRFDGNHYVDVSVPPAFQGQLCGMCGNYNSDPRDDNLKPDGKPAGDSTLLGDSWVVPANSTECPSLPPPTCEPEMENEIRRNSACTMITDSTGTFKDCHAVVDPAPFFENCVYDVCLTNGQQTSLCYGLQAYAESCANAGVCLEWRNSTVCPLSCPAGSHFRSCGDRCSPSCVAPSSLLSSCSPFPVEGCFCDEGFLLSGDRCVPESSCGCLDRQDTYHQLGGSWFSNGVCSERCTCGHNNTITCRPWECGVQETCGVQDGVLGCHPSSRASCHVVGDPHYYTFDKVMHTFLGTCTYTLVTVCNSSSSVTPVTISGRNEDRGQTGAAYLREVYVDVYGIRVTLQKSKRILFDDERVFAPVESRSRGNVAVGNVGIYVVLETDFGLLVKYDGSQYLDISLPGTYFSQVCGLCGNYNGRAEDELLLPSGAQAKNVTQFGNSWKVEADSEASCVPDTREELGPPCTPQEKPAMEEQCSVLQSSPAFAPCHRLVKPELFVQTCLFDMCKYGGMRSTLCAIVQAYADTCKAEGAVLSWRNSTFCPLPCPSNSHYTPCASLCPPTCNNLYADALCEKPPGGCLEGCACNEGYVLSDDQCVPLSECGCRDGNDNYHKVGESWVTPHCSQKCRCRPGGIIKCQSFDCEVGEICQLKNNGKYGCKPTGFGKCLITGDPHYLTFDGLLHHFQGTHTYVVTQSRPDAPQRLEPFSVKGKNEAQDTAGKITFLNELEITVYNHTVLFRQGKELVLDGVVTVPPAQPHEGLRIQQRSTQIFLETDFGLSVSFDGAENSDLTLPNTYKQKAEGLCGNFDGKYKNDFRTPDGTLVKDVHTFGESWRVPVVRGTSRLRRHTLSEEELDGAELDLGFTLNCTLSQLQQVNSSSNCGMLADPSGPFQACSGNVSSAPFLKNCLYDMCVESDRRAVRCRSLEQYALACQEKGVTLADWRERTSCALKCPPNSKYSPCTSACPASCADLAAPAECQGPCLEGCQCLPGYVLSGFDCVPFRECGCTFLGRYYKAGESFVTEDCRQLCTCTDSSSLACSKAACAPSEVCTVANFTRGCYRAGSCLPNPCLNDGVCSESDSPAGFNCTCPVAFHGDLCEIEEAQTGSPPGPPAFTLLYIILGIVGAVILVLAVAIAVVLCACRPRKRAQNPRGRDAWSLHPSRLPRGAQQGLGDLSNLAFEED
ncbi:zonadhesin-like [Hemicordylus capensis]|uniref:zonadhesin-like n=1 Tax=Hemicordylus capensis TaxID=884348 RepID=UPI0023024D9D|nr:zonadhesin-like [Hemicordylus capensis]